MKSLIIFALCGTVIARDGKALEATPTPAPTVQQVQTYSAPAAGYPYYAPGVAGYGSPYYTTSGTVGRVHNPFYFLGPLGFGNPYHALCKYLPS